jgi:cytochrome c biogenesis protein CcmG/thiol:disulfide interchange protein DsbE
MHSYFSKFVPVFAFCGLAVLFFIGASSDPKSVAAGYLDRPLPDFNLTPMVGTDTGLSHQDLEAHVSMINVFASWCGACKREHPYLMELATTTDVPIYGVNWKDRKGGGKLFLTRAGNPYRSIGDDSLGVLGDQLNVTGVPETYIIDGFGKIRYRHIGPITKLVWQETLLPLISTLRGQS